MIFLKKPNTGPSQYWSLSLSHLQYFIFDQFRSVCLSKPIVKPSNKTRVTTTMNHRILLDLQITRYFYKKRTSLFIQSRMEGDGVKEIDGGYRYFSQLEYFFIMKHENKYIKI